MLEDFIDPTLESVKDVADHVRRCPACNSDHIYTAVNMAYIYDHRNHRLDAVQVVNLAEHGWHGCFICNHQWVSNQLIKSAFKDEPETSPTNVIDFEQAKRERSIY
jgi:hypothetical protein